jgi:hypothetical protein
MIRMRRELGLTAIVAEGTITPPIPNPAIVARPTAKEGLVGLTAAILPVKAAVDKVSADAYRPTRSLTHQHTRDQEQFSVTALQDGKQGVHDCCPNRN